MTGSSSERPDVTEWTEAKISALTRHSSDIISLLDASGRLLYNSPATERINGFKPEELIGVDTFDFMHPDDRGAVGAAFAKLLATPGGTVTVEYRYRNRGGAWQWMEAVASNQLTNPDVRGVVANTRDISDRKRHEQEKRELEERLMHAHQLESLGTLAAGVAHDFNNLLSVVLGEATLLTATTTPGQARDAAAQIIDAANRAAGLTQTLLACAGKARFTRGPVSLPAVLSSMEADLRALVPPGARLVVEVDATTPLIDAAEERLRQVVLNLVRNAAEALTGAGEVTVRVGHGALDAAVLARCSTCEGLAAGPAVFISVADTGHGLSPESRQHLFEPYYSTRHFGRGLGLAAVAGIVRGFRGAIEVADRPGGGTIFTTWFASRAPAVQPHVSGEAFVGQGLVLVVDDEAPTARAAARLLRHLGYTVELAVDGQDALERYADRMGELSLVLLDVVMPRLDGPRTFTRLRQLRADLPVLFYSGYDAESVEAALQQPRTLFLQKPFELATLQQCLRALLGGQPAGAVT